MFHSRQFTHRYTTNIHSLLIGIVGCISAVKIKNITFDFFCFSLNLVMRRAGHHIY